jgi:hypothetical protein
MEEFDHLLYNVYKLNPELDARVIQDTTNSLVKDCTRMRDSNASITVGWLHDRVAFYLANVRLIRVERKRRESRSMFFKLFGRKDA